MGNTYVRGVNLRESECYPGMRVGRLTLVSRTRIVNEKSGHSRGAWTCTCDCGNKTTVRTDGLGVVNGKGTVSCGCLNRENNLASATRKLHKKYAKSDSRPGAKFHSLYNRWIHIKERCYKESSKSYSEYGARGIKMCDSWKNSYLEFKDWALSSGFNPSLSGIEQSIDRIDVNGNYEPNNCRWASIEVQANNKRNNRYISWYGEKITLGELANRFGFSHSVIKNRYDKKGYRNVMLICPLSTNPKHPEQRVECNRKSIEDFYSHNLGKTMSQEEV